LTPQDRKALAEQILSNPLVPVILAEIERDAVERGVFAPMTDHEARSAAMAEVRAIRAFRQHLEASLRDTPPRKGAPA
jgi:hypothetical protein